jgi:hypothetical protein
MRTKLNSLLPFLLLAAGCASGGDADFAPEVAGVWQHTSGDLYSGYGTLDYLELSADGSGEMFLSRPGGALGCASLVHAALSADVLQLTISQGSDDVVRFARLGDSLQLTDLLGHQSTFLRVAGVPDSARCKKTVEVRRAVIDGGYNGWSSIVGDATALYYANRAEQVIPLDPATLAAGTPITTLGYHENVIAMQNGDFWAHCACGGSEYARRMTPAGVVVDDVDTSDFPNQIQVGAAAWDGSRLWLAGTSNASPRPELLMRVDSESEPDVLESTATLDTRVSAMDFENGQLYVLTQVLGQVLVEMTPSGQVTRTWDLPGGPWYRGMSVVGSTVYLLAESGNEDALVVVVSLEE